jgi:hypothetical protein
MPICGCGLSGHWSSISSNAAISIRKAHIAICADRILPWANGSRKGFKNVKFGASAPQSGGKLAFPRRAWERGGAPLELLPTSEINAGWCKLAPGNPRFALTAGIDEYVTEAGWTRRELCELL